MQKAANAAGLGANLRVIPARGTEKDATNPYALDATDLVSAMEEDNVLGWTPIFVSASVGTTSSCPIDPVSFLARGCRR